MPLFKKKSSSSKKPLLKGLSNIVKTAVNVTTAPARGLVGIGKNNQLEKKLELKVSDDSKLKKFNTALTKASTTIGLTGATIATAGIAAPGLASTVGGGALAKKVVSGISSIKKPTTTPMLGIKSSSNVIPVKPTLSVIKTTPTATPIKSIVSSAVKESVKSTGTNLATNLSKNLIGGTSGNTVGVKPLTGILANIKAPTPVLNTKVGVPKTATVVTLPKITVTPPIISNQPSVAMQEEEEENFIDEVQEQALGVWDSIVEWVTENKVIAGIVGGVVLVGSAFWFFKGKRKKIW